MADRSPYLVVKFESTRDGIEALLAHLAKVPSTYTPLGAAAATACEAMRDALRGEGSATTREIRQQAVKDAISEDETRGL